MKNQFSEKQSAKSSFYLLFTGLAIAAALLIGVAMGYVFSQSQADGSAQVVVTATPDNSQANPPSSPTQADTSASTSPENDNAAPTPSIMDLVLSDARHFQGSAEAPITMIEFSDFK